MDNLTTNEPAGGALHSAISYENAQPSLPKKPEQLQSIATLMNSEERLRLIEENVRDFAIIVLDIEGCMVGWNIGAERILGYREEEVLGRSIALIFTPEDENKGTSAGELKTAAATGRAEDERWHQRRDGSRFWASGIMTGLRDDSGALCGYIKILRDFTARKQAQEHIETLNVRLQRGIRDGLHRTKNNLHMVAALVELQAAEHEGTLPVEEVHQVVAHVRLLAEVHDLLTHEITSEGHSATVPADVVLEKLLALLQKTTGQRLLKPLIAPVPLLGKQVMALALATNEICTNALKYSRGNVTVTFTADQEVATLEVCDDGPGFKETFSPLLDSNIGLDLVGHIVRIDLSGQIRYENRPEGGARVVVDFPIPQTAAPTVEIRS
jgi:PAS domain S-box-containing protein